MPRTEAPARRHVRRHPIRSAVAGFLGGVGVALLLGLYGIITIGTATPFVVIALTTVFGVVWGMFAPPRKPRHHGTRAAAPAPVPAAGDDEQADAPLA